MKKIIKNRIFIVIITMIICISGTLYATTKYNASEILYNPSNGEATNVNDALNELYDKINNEMNMQLTLVPSLSNDNGCGSSGVKESCYANVSINNNGYTKMDCYYYDAYFPMYLKIDKTSYSMQVNTTKTFDITGKKEILFYTLTSDSTTYTNRTRVRVRLYN